jgi:hypothetical protein
MLYSRHIVRGKPSDDHFHDAVATTSFQSQTVLMTKALYRA